jgi:hypothetical protein
MEKVSEDIFTTLNAHQRELIEPAAKLFAIQKVYGDEVRKKTMKAYGQLADAHMLTTGVLASGLLRIDGKILSSTPEREERNALFASFVIGMTTCESSIAEGRYLQAIALLRQELETLATLKGVSIGKPRKKESRNVNVLDESLKRLYGSLSDAAHLESTHIVRNATKLDVSVMDFPEQTSATRYFPSFDEGLARRLFSLYLMLILRLIEELSIDLGDDGFTEQEAHAVKLALQLMQSEGMVEFL